MPNVLCAQRRRRGVGGSQDRRRGVSGSLSAGHLFGEWGPVRVAKRGAGRVSQARAQTDTEEKTRGNKITQSIPDPAAARYASTRNESESCWSSHSFGRCRGGLLCGRPRGSWMLTSKLAVGSADEHLRRLGRRVQDNVSG